MTLTSNFTTLQLVAYFRIDLLLNLAFSHGIIVLLSDVYHTYNRLYVQISPLQFNNVLGFVINQIATMKMPLSVLGDTFFQPKHKD